DMELVIVMQSPEILSVGNTPNNLEEYFKRFLLRMGYSATAFASNRRTNIGPLASTREPRSLKELGQVGRVFADRCCNNAPTVAFTTESIQPIVDLRWKITVMMRIRAERTDPNKLLSGTLIARSSKRTGSSTSMLAFLEDIENALHAEQLEVSIDYLLLHRTCWQLLRQMNVACKSKLLGMYGAGSLKKENQLPIFVVGYIFITATQTKKVANLLLPGRTEEVTSKLLAMAGEAVEKFVKTKNNGDVLVRMLRTEYGYGLDFRELS
ncbi:MAG: hypothetical protein Q9224_007717, partial [Gallowayella concinna]